MKFFFIIPILPILWVQTHICSAGGNREKCHHYPNPWIPLLFWRQCEQIYMTIYARSRMPETPMPPPPQIASMPYLDLRLFISLRRVINFLVQLAMQDLHYRAIW